LSGPAGGIFADFLGFLKGVGENVVFFDGEFVVSLWWIDGKLR
jgi:hypothetical protein